ncbi:MAG TPA: FecR family protein [Candidatus Angelobacter sp.]|nr:FecR family protein [Candidatus Angelobacter sp.]
MRRLSTRNNHWLLFSLLLILVLIAAPLLQASGQSQPSRTQNQSADPVPADQNQDQPQDVQPDRSQLPEQAQGTEPIQTEDGIQEQDQMRSSAPYDPNDPANYSHARIVRLSYVDGQVRIDHGQGYESATMNVPVTEHNWLQTRSDGWAEVQFEDGSLMRIAPDTVIAFTELSRLASGVAISTIDLDQGEGEFRVAQGSASQFQVTVKNKTVALDRAATFRVTSTNADPLEVVVWKGAVTIRDSESGGEVAVKKNETFVLDPTDVAQYGLDKGADADDLDQWSKQRDDYLSTYASRGGYSQSPYQYGAGDLNYYGEYFDDPSYGMVWQPNGVNLGWDPFGNGYWSYAPGFGYTWISSYPWGWLPFRYGHWVFVNGRGWCWVPGNWQHWHTGPTWVNAPPGFHAPRPPAGNVLVLKGAPGGRIVRPGTAGEGSGLLRNAGPGIGRTLNHEGGGEPGIRGTRHVFTNEDVARVPRTDVPAQAAPNVVDADRKPNEVQRQPDGNSGQQPSKEGFRSSHEAPPVNRPDDVAPRLPHARTSDSPQPHAAPPPSQPVRESTRPAQVIHQSSPAPMRQSSSPAAHSPSSGGGGRSSGKPR